MFGIYHHLAIYHFQNYRPSDLADSLLVYCLLSCLHQDLFRSIPDALKFDLSEGEDSMKFKDRILHSHRKIRYVLKNQHLYRYSTLQDSTLDEETGIFLENQETPHPCFPASFFFFFKCCLLQMQT